MKKVLLTAMAILTVASASVFGMYGVDGDDWINFLTHGNQFRARMDQLGFVLGNGTIKGTFGFRADTGWMGNIFNIDRAGGTSATGINEYSYFNPTVSAGIGYTSDAFGIGVGYNFTYIDKYLQVHTPTLVFNALNDNLRIAVPIQVAVTDNIGGVNGIKFTGVGFNQMELRYYTGIDAFNAIRVYASYKNATIDVTRLGKRVYEDLHLQLRLYFLNTQIGNVTVNPYIRIDYATLLQGAGTAGYDSFITVGNYNNFAYHVSGTTETYSVKPYTIKIKPVLSLAASSDIVSLYFEPSLGYAMTSYKVRGVAETTTHALNWGAYAEMYVTPVQDLEWYFEMDVNGNVTGAQKVANADLAPVLFETTTGITWYLPSLGGDTAQ
ncbi:cell surface protein [uncultured Brachyspira sp.]|uniref:cell surface protein n=1 Tax=uncultured Brachyspira sp. TaxID=221953 RepID=UPI002622FDF9|nr:cell surface protein [uncultured Brachyspira sp.]